MRLGRAGATCHIDSAWNYFEECNQILRDTRGVQSVNYAALLHSKGKAHLSSGDLHEALATFDQAKEILESLPEQHDRYVISLLALNMRCLGDVMAEESADMEEALAYYRQCRELQLNSIGVEAVEVSNTERKMQSLINRSLRGSSKSPLKTNATTDPVDSIV